jgi:hypothetical protein
MQHHPEKFGGRHVLWRGIVYSSLPITRSLGGTRVNTGQWGTALFPSIYRDDSPPFAYMPHSCRWQAASIGLIALGMLMAVAPQLLPAPAGVAPVMMLAGLMGLAVTWARCVGYACRSGIDSLPRMRPFSRLASRAIYRTAIAWFHFIQPFARAHGRVRGLISPPQSDGSPHRETNSTALRGTTAWSPWLRLRILLMAPVEQRFWSESYVGAVAVLEAIVQCLRASRAVRRIDLDEGWWLDRDISLGIGFGARLDMRILVEEHESGKCLLRVSNRLRCTSLGFGAIAAAVATLAFALATPLISAHAAAIAGAVCGALLFAMTAWQAAGIAAAATRAVDAAAWGLGMQPVSATPTWASKDGAVFETVAQVATIREDASVDGQAAGGVEYRARVRATSNANNV